MKKIYHQPELAIIEIELLRMIAASNEVVIDPTNTGDPSEADSRFIEGILGLP